MGDPSYLCFIPASSATVTLDWSKVPEESKVFFLRGWGHDWATGGTRPLPPTIGDLAKMVDESQFFGYMRQEIITLRLDISKFGLYAGLPTLFDEKGITPVGPRFYMKYLNYIWVIIFTPGKREGIIAYSHDVEGDLDYSNDEEMEKEFANDRMVAEEFDPRLCDEFSRFGELEIIKGRKIADWSGMLSSDLEKKWLFG